MSKEVGGVTLLTKGTLEGHEQVLSYLNLEESDLDDAFSETSFDLESFADEELYEDLVFSTPPNELEREEEIEDESFDEEEMIPLEALHDPFFDPEVSHYVLDDYETPFMTEDEEEADVAENEDLSTIKRLTKQLLNKNEVEALKIALAKSQDDQQCAQTEEVASLAAVGKPQGIALGQVSSPPSPTPARPAPAREEAYLPDYPSENLPADFPVYLQASPSLDLNALQAPAEQLAHVEIPAEASLEEPSSPSSSSSSESELSEAEQSSQESEIDVEEVDAPLPLNLVLALRNAQPPSRPQKRPFRFIEEQDDDSESETELLPSSRPSRPSTPLLEQPRPRPSQARDSHRRKLDLPRTPISASPTSSRPSSASSSRASSPSPSPVPRSSGKASFVVSSKKPSPLESTLHFRIQHLFPADRMAELVHLMEVEPRARVVTSSPELQFDLSSLPASRLEKIGDFVNQCIKQRGNQGLRQEEQSPRTVLKAKRQQQQQQQQPSSPKPNDPPQPRRGRARKDASPAAPSSLSKKVSSSPLHTATSQPLPSAYSPKTTATTIIVGGGRKEQPREMVEDSEDEIDVVGI